MTIDPGQMVPQHPQQRLHRTPLHHQLLSLVAARQIEWLPEAGVSGAPAGLGGRRITDPATLVAFFELRRSGLVEVHGSVVALTFPGERRLAEWAVIR